MFCNKPIKQCLYFLYAKGYSSQSYTRRYIQVVGYSNAVWQQTPYIYSSNRKYAKISKALVPLMEERKLKAKYRGKIARSIKEEQILKDIEEFRQLLPEFCTGCGIQLQAHDPDAPGYYQIPKKLLQQHIVQHESDEDEQWKGGSKARAAYDQREFFQEEDNNWEQEMEERSDETEGRQEQEEYFEEEEEEEGSAVTDEVDELFKQGPEEKRYQQKMQQLNQMMENSDQEVEDKDKLFIDTPQDSDLEEEDKDKIDVELLCARCFSLRYRGQIKSEKAEGLLPVFDFARVVGQKIRQWKARRHVIVCVVDLADFDGSLPRQALKQIIPAETEVVQGPGHKFILVANKLDLMPETASRQRLEQWVLKRAKQGGIPQPDSIHLVSALENKGVKHLLIIIRRLLGYAGDVWIVGAQNSGKSTLINSLMKQGMKHKYNKNKKEVTTAALPGTTLGLLQVKDIALPFKCRGFDTPGIVHLHQLSGRLNPDEVRMLIPRRSLKPRTYRVCPGYTLSIGAVGRVDILSSPASTLYVTFWASDEIVCHMGRTANAERTRDRHAGITLIPPLGGIERVKQIGEFVSTKVYVEGDRWTGSSHDICIAGIGWVAVGVKGRADFMVWAHPGVAITTRESIIPDFSRRFEKIGWGNKSIKLKTTLKKKLYATKGTQPWMK
eukprot:TRINITY_DN9534_c0_g1_i2.p1 TRINITY_DN9534_c0_g1~~TRINITY_DN9534_c0_g1_i2.p1  ORF type:complete len:667 (-),score=116.85 TRINITY_DN9534_c0_g1_i2:172-2172(-)